MTIALVGNPNCGKTTLFNALTGSTQTVGNWPGVTVERKEADVPLPDGRVARLVDLPGTYALEAHTVEERVTQSYLTHGAADVILNVVDATQLERHFYLTTQLMDTGLPVIVALNCMDDFTLHGGKLDAAALSRALGVPALPISARKRTGLSELRAALQATWRPHAYRTSRGVAVSTPEARRAQIQRILEQADYHAPHARRFQRTLRIDRQLVRPRLAIPLAVFSFGLLFWLTFGPVGGFLSGCVGVGAGVLNALIRIVMQAFAAPDWLMSLVIEGVCTSVAGLLTFLPQLMIVFAGIALIEDSGVMARAAFVADRWFRTLGLSGRSVIPLMTGFGCTTTAVLAARGVDDERDRIMTILLTPFMSCGARLPVYALFSAAFFPHSRVLVVSSLYVWGMVAAMIWGRVLRKSSFVEKATPFILELPLYRRPSLRNVATKLRLRASDFIRRAGTVIVLASAIVWFFRYFTPSFTPASSEGESLFGQLGAGLAVLFRPLGFGEATYSIAWLAGLVAKEAVVSTFMLLYGAADATALTAAVAQNGGTPLVAYSYMVFILFSVPCVSALAAMRRELNGMRYVWRVIGMNLLTAYTASLLVYQIGRWI